jgi:hypothetical protein
VVLGPWCVQRKLYANTMVLEYVYVYVYLWYHLVASFCQFTGTRVLATVPW